MDRISADQRSLIMSHIRGKDTSIEIQVRSYLFNAGFRFRKNVRKLPGTPDIVLKKYKTVIFINGCFWHHHKGCKHATIPKTNVDYWENKFQKNIANDNKNKRELRKLGYKVIVVWECELKKNFEKRMGKLIKEINKLT